MLAIALAITGTVVASMCAGDGVASALILDVPAPA